MNHLKTEIITKLKSKRIKDVAKEYESQGFTYKQIMYIKKCVGPKKRVYCDTFIVI